jgi:hypothetical protein
MPTITLKRGSQVTIPLPTGWTVTSESPNIMGATKQGNNWVLTAGTSPGSCWLTAMVASDLKASVLVNVV